MDEININTNAELITILNDIGDADYDSRSKGSALMFGWVDKLLEHGNFSVLHDLLSMSHVLPLAYIVCLLMATNNHREACTPARDILINNLTDKYNAVLIEGMTIQEFLIGLI